VYNRPDELDELLMSLSLQSYRDFEVIVVEDGSPIKCEQIAAKYSDAFPVTYLYKENSGPGDSRNAGATQSNGNYLIFLDSDCIAPAHYLAEVNRNLTDCPCDAFGGPDCADRSFTPIQKAINYSMTSFFTTGGIRGGKKKLDKFYPRSFNMGVKKTVFEQLHGFSSMRFGEDIDFSIRIVRQQFSTLLFPSAFVYHKRRTDFRKFFRQVYNSGMARINLFKKYPDSLKPVHLLPVLFLTGSIILLLCTVVCPYSLLPLCIFAGLILADASRKTHSFYIGLLAVKAAFIQLAGYGAGFLHAFWKRCLMRQGEIAAFQQTFYN
jgi:glycosyltransferase involved in cell wall biosynthesis